MLFKGPYHVDALTHVPLLWRPAPVSGIASGVIDAPVGHVDIAPTIAAAAGLEVQPQMQGRLLPASAADESRERVYTEWLDNYDDNEIHLQTMVRDGYLITRYGPTNRYDGSEGELYALADDPHQWRNLWNEAEWKSLRDDLVADLLDHLPDGRDEPLPKVAPV